MVKIDVNNIKGEKVKSFELNIYDLDNQNSILIRLASEIKTIPRYLYFPEGVPSLEQLNKEYSITVEDLLQDIISIDKGDLDFVTLANRIKGKLDQQKLDLRDDVLLPFVAYDSSILLDPRNILHALSDAIESANLFEIESVESLLRDLRNFWENDRKQTIERFRNKINKVQKEATEQKKRYEDFDKVSKKIRYTTFEQESITFEFFLDLVDITVMEIFNHVRLNSAVPFAAIDNFFKIFNDFNPPDTWRRSAKNGIIFKVLQKKILNTLKHQDYADVLLVIDGELGKENVVVEMSLLTSGNLLQRDEMIKRFLTSIYGLGDIDVKNITEKSIKGSFYFPNHSLNKYVFADLLMNNELFSSMMSIDEREKATKKKESIYIHFYNSKIGKLTANITEKISVRNDSDLRGKDINGEFKFGSRYIRIKIVIAENIQAVLIFQDLFSKLLAIYDQEYPAIIAFYEKYTPITTTEKEEDEDKPQTIVKNRLKDIAPEVFVSGYSQKCAFPPTIIDDNDHKALEEAKEKGLEIMRYPKDDDEQKDDKLFPSRNYVCNNPKAKFPGLHENQFEKNKDMVRYIPCCFKKANNKFFRQYFNGEEPTDKIVTTQQDLIISKKFVSADKYGTLPTNLNKMFDIFDYDEDYIYVRKGVNYSKGAKSSFLECVMEGMYKETGILESTDREAFLEEKRDELATAANAAACSQEMYDYTLSEIIDIIRDSRIYMEPSLFSSLLEQHFNCNIFVFSRSDNNTNLIIPRHIHAYYKNKRENAKCIFIYEHKGSSADKEKGTRCELIVKWEKRVKDNVFYYYPYRSKVSKGVRDVYMSMIKSYALKNEIVESSIPKILNTKKLKFLEQGLDTYGKCRMLRFSIDSSNVTILTDPLQPFVIPAAINWIATKTTKETAIKLANAIGIQFSGQCIREDVLKEIYGKFGDVNITIPVFDTDKMDLPEENNRIIIQTSNYSSLSNYNEYKKLSRYVVEYMLWLFSKYLNEDCKTPSIETINSFVKDKVKIVPDFKYGKVKTIFSETSGVMEEGKLVVKSQETLKRLVYTLRLSIRRFREKIEKYHESKTIENFYLDVTDFDQYPRQVILYGKDSIDKWNNEKNNKHIIYNSVQLDLDLPYFFKNANVKADTVFLAQNTPTLQKAMEIGETWVKSGFNVDGEANGDGVASFEFKLYRYINSNDIVLYNIEGDTNSFKIKVLGWKYKGKSSFAVLLPL